MRRRTAVLITQLLSTPLLLVALAASIRAEDNLDETRKPGLSSEDLQDLLTAGRVAGRLPVGFCVRLQAEMWASGDTERFKECLEITPDEAHHCIVRVVNGSTSYVRIRSVPIATRDVCQTLLSGGLLDIDERKGTGKPTLFAGTHYKLGSRQITILVPGKAPFVVGESCAVAPMPESDARAFGALYEKLAAPARAALAQPAERP